MMIATDKKSDDVESAKALQEMHDEHKVNKYSFDLI